MNLETIIANCGLRCLNILEANNYRLWYTLAAYLLYAGWFSMIGVIGCIFEGSLEPLGVGFLVGYILGIIVAVEAYFKHPAMPIIDV